MKKIKMMVMMMFIAGAVSAQSNDTSFDYFAQMKTVAPSSLIQVEKGASTQGLFCTMSCRNQYIACMAQPDPYNINLDVCRIKRNQCLSFCNGGNAF